VEESDRLPEEPRKSPWFRWSLAGVIVAAGVVVALFIRDQLRTAIPVAGAVGAEEGIEFEVVSGNCGASSVSVASGITAKPNRGTFCVVTFVAENLGEAPRTLDASCMYLIDRSGERYSPREDIAALRETSGGLFDEGLGPFERKPVAVGLYYDVPATTEAEAVEMHASCGSRGLHIELPA
jgi:hypothetical protein